MVQVVKRYEGSRDTDQYQVNTPDGTFNLVIHWHCGGDNEAIAWTEQTPEGKEIRISYHLSPIELVAQDIYTQYRQKLFGDSLTALDDVIEGFGLKFIEPEWVEL
jgi:hypothetical protein